MLNLVVSVKAVPDPKEACNIRIDPATKTLMRCEVPLVVNPLDKNAMEAALQLKARHGARITVLSMGPPEAGNIVKECLALGADRGVLLSDRAFGGADAFATAWTLAQAIRKLGPFDLVLCGMASSDGSTEWVGPQMATFLGIPAVTMVTDLVACDGPLWEVKAALENGYRRVQVRLPALLTVTRDLNTPRALSFSGIIKARKKEIDTWDLERLGATPQQVGLAGSPTIVTGMSHRENTRQVEMLAGTREEKAQQLLEKLVDAGLL